MGSDLFFIPLGGSGGSGDLSNYYTKSQIDAMLADFVTDSTNSLINYYLKSETYSQAEINSLISAIETTHFEVFASLSDITDPQGNVLYLVGPVSETGDDRYEIYIYANNQFVKIDDTSVDLTGYATTADLQNAVNTAMSTLQNALGNYYQKSEVDEMLQGVQTLQGIQGIKGADGVNGADGAQGIQGIAGQNGTNGVDGLQGLQGVQGIQGPAGGGSGGGSAWYGTQAQFDALENPSADVDYFISDKIEWTEIKGKPNMSKYTTKTYVDNVDLVLDKKIGSKIGGQFLSQEQFQSITPKEGENYFIEGTTVEMVFTFTDNTQETYNMVID